MGAPLKDNKVTSVKWIILTLVCSCWVVGWSVAVTKLEKTLGNLHPALDAIANLTKRKIAYRRTILAVPLYAAYAHVALAAVVSTVTRATDVGNFYQATELFFSEKFVLNPRYLGACAASAMLSLLSLTVLTSRIESYNDSLVGTVVGAAVLPWAIGMIFFMSINAFRLTDSFAFVIGGCVVTGILVAGSASLISLAA